MGKPNLAISPPALLTAARASDGLAGISSRLQGLREIDRRVLVQAAQPRTEGLPADIDYDVRNAVLYIEIVGQLDLRCTLRLQAIAHAIDETVVASRIGLDGVSRIFDSGIAALVILVSTLAGKGIGWIRIDGQDLRFDLLYPSGLDRCRAALREACPHTDG